MNLSFCIRTSNPSAADSPFSDIVSSMDMTAGKVLKTTFKLPDRAVHLVSVSVCNAIFPFDMPGTCSFSSYNACLFEITVDATSDIKYVIHSRYIVNALFQDKVQFVCKTVQIGRLICSRCGKMLLNTFVFTGHVTCPVEIFTN